MSYQPLTLDEKTPSVVERFVRQHLEMQFHDIHCMLRLPLPELDIKAGCNFAVANSLLSLVSGLSAFLTENIDTSGNSGSKFKEVLLYYYPWDLQSPVNSTKERSVDHLYEYFRNPLAHSLGLRSKGNFLIVIAKGNLSEQEIEKLEQSITPQAQAIEYTPITLNNEQIEQITLYVEYFYWGVREMLKRLSMDAAQMQKTEQGLKSLGLA